MALTTATEVRIMFPAVTGTGLDANIGTYITRAEEALAQYCGFPGVAGAAPKLEQQSYVMYLTDAVHPEHAQVLQLPLRPVVSVTSVYDDADRDYGAATEVVEADDFSVDKTGGALVLLGSSTHAWSSSFESLKVTAVCGLTTGSIPDFVKQAVAMTVKANWEKRHHAGVDQSQVAGDSVTYSEAPFFVPPDAARMIGALVMHERKMSGSQGVRFG